MRRVLFARVGWMRWYRGPQPDDEKPIGGGKYNNSSLGNEAFNFQPVNGEMFAYFQPRLSPQSIRDKHPSNIALERIEPHSHSDSLTDVLTIFVATHPTLGGQRIVGWFKSCTVYRHEQELGLKERLGFTCFIRASEDLAVLVPEGQRDFIVPGGKGAFGQANVCYTLDSKGRPKKNASWIEEALLYIDDYDRENASRDPASGTDTEIADAVAATLESSAGFQSNPRIRKAIEVYAMQWARKYFESLNYAWRDTHQNKPYDYTCVIDGTEVYVEVKGMQDSGQAISLTPREVQHAQDHKNSALFIVHSVTVTGKRTPVVSGGTMRFLYPWDISVGTLRPRSFVHTLAN